MIPEGGARSAARPRPTHHRTLSTRRLFLATTLVVGLMTSLGPPQAGAQSTDTLGPLRRAVARTKPQTRVRVELRDGRRFSGVLAPVRADALAIADPAGRQVLVPYEDVTRYWRRGRAIAYGAGVVGVIGVGVGALIGAVAAGLCEYDCPSSEGSAMLTGAVGVGALGVGVGAIIGAAIPQWHQAWYRRRTRADRDRPLAPLVSVDGAGDSAVAPARPGAHAVGEITAMLTAGYASFGPGPLPAEHGPGVGASLGMAFRLGPVGFGPEVGLMTGTTGTLKRFAGVGRVELRHRGFGVRVPYLLAGAGANAWTGRDVLFTATLGAGVTLGGRGRIEVRWNPVLQYSDPSRPYPTLLTVGIGRTLGYW